VPPDGFDECKPLTCHRLTVRDTGQQLCSGQCGADCGTAEWYVIHVKPRRESTVHLHLERHGIESLSPMLAVLRLGRGWRTEPLFPGYVFARFDWPSTDHDAVRWAPGVKTILGTDVGPMPVQRSFIEAIAARDDRYGSARMRIPFSLGDSVRIADGPMAGLTGVLVKLSSRERTQVLLDLLAVRVEIRAQSLERLR
jgi:transcription antitermination factor NusG